MKQAFKQFCQLLSSNLNEQDFLEIDWEAVITQAEQHRLSAHLPHQITELKVKVPQKELGRLKKQAENAKFKMLVLSREAAILAAQFEAQNLAVLFLKGPVQSYQIYQDFTVKSSRDLDILVKPSSINKAIDTLLNQGYQLISPFLELTAKQQAYFIEHYNQLVLFHPQRKCQVELHWSLFANRQLLDFTFTELQASAVSIQIGKQVVKGLGSTHMKLYLLAHGAKHAWSEIYWLKELTDLMEKKKGDRKEFLNLAKRKGLQQLLYQYLLLIKHLLGKKLEEDLIIKGKGDQKAIWLYQQSLIEMQQIKKSKGLVAYTKALRYKISLKKSWAYKTDYFKAFTINDFLLIKLPDSLFFLYYFLRPFLWIKRYILK